jgi:signal recognition particle receptor subunit beta
MALLKESEIAGVPVLILANKSDLPQSQPAAHVAQILDLARINAVSPSHASTVIRPWTIQQTSAVTGQGLDVGMDWYPPHIYDANNHIGLG